MRRAPILAFMACLATSVAGVATASVLTDHASPPSAPPADLTATPGTDGTGARTRDPVGGPDWAVRTYTSLGGQSCIEVGRTDGRNFGRANERGEVQHQPAQQQGTCAAKSAAPVQIAVNRYADPQRTVVFGQASDDVVRISVGRPDGERDVPVGERQTFVLVVRGVVPPAELPITAHLSDGSAYQEDWR